MLIVISEIAFHSVERMLMYVSAAVKAGEVSKNVRTQKVKKPVPKTR